LALKNKNDCVTLQNFVYFMRENLQNLLCANESTGLINRGIGLLEQVAAVNKACFKPVK
jgi:hypothetical protein